MLAGCNNSLYNINIHTDEIDPPLVIEFSKKRISLKNDFSNNNQNRIPLQIQYYVSNKVIFGNIIKEFIDYNVYIFDIIFRTSIAT